jgi:hypothetical protein
MPNITKTMTVHEHWKNERRMGVGITPRATIVKCLQKARVAAVILCAASSATAADRFEIQVYDGSADKRGEAGIELHLNSFANGSTASVPPELPLAHQSHATLEPSYGITDFWEVGGYLQSAMLANGDYHYGGVKLRSKFVTTEGFSKTIRLGVNLEISNVPSIFEQNVWGGEIRPMFAVETRRFLFAFNPIIELDLAHTPAKEVAQLAPAALGLVKVAGLIGLGFEYYGSLGPLTSPRLSNHDEHLLFEALHIFSDRDIELSFGVGEAISDTQNQLIFKTIVGYTFDVSGRRNLSH